MRLGQATRARERQKGCSKRSRDRAARAGAPQRRRAHRRRRARAAQVVHSSAPGKTSRPERLACSLNALLPPDVAALRAAPARADFVARAAAARSYRYRRVGDGGEARAGSRHVWVVRGALNGAALRAARRCCRAAATSPPSRPRRTSYHTCDARCAEPPAAPPAAGRCSSTATGRQLLDNMVRVAVGSMADVAQGRMTLRSSKRRLPSASAAAWGSGSGARALRW